MLRLSLLASILLLACSSSSSSSSGSPQRSATCLAYQEASCEYAADRCGSITRSECEDLARALFCKSDAVVAPCVEALPKAACGTPPESCRDVIDRAPAVSLCNQTVQRLCATYVRCDQYAAADCQAAVGEVLRCEKAIGAAPEIDLCFRALDAAACPMSTLPEVCRGVIKVATDGSALSRSDPWGLTAPF